MNVPGCGRLEMERFEQKMKKTRQRISRVCLLGVTEDPIRSSYGLWECCLENKPDSKQIF